MLNYVSLIFLIFGVLNIPEDGFCPDSFQHRVKLWELTLRRAEIGREVNLLAHVNHKTVKKISRLNLHDNKNTCQV